MKVISIKYRANGRFYEICLNNRQYRSIYGKFETSFYPVVKYDEITQLEKAAQPRNMKVLQQYLTIPGIFDFYGRQAYESIVDQADELICAGKLYQAATVIKQALSALYETEITIINNRRTYHI